MLTYQTPSNISGNRAKSGDIYRFKNDSFWEGEWITDRVLNEPEGSEYIRLTRQEYLQMCSEVPASGCVFMKEKTHAALYKILLAREYTHFGVTGIKTLYLILCVEGYFGEKYEKITTHEAIRKLIGGRADCSHASESFWQACYTRIKEKDPADRVSLKEFTHREKEVWRAFIRKSSESCNRKK